MPRADGSRCSQRSPSSRISPAVTSSTPASLDGDAVAGAKHTRLSQKDGVALTFRWPAIDARGAMEPGQAQARNGEFAAPDRQRRAASMQRNLAPAAAGGPEVAPASAAGGLKTDLTD